MEHDTQVGSLEGQGEGEEGSAVRISIAPNPSHLEYVGPVVLGMVRAEQTRLQDHSRRRVMGLLIHGDAAFAGLGIVAECFQLADVPGEQKLVTLILCIGFLQCPASTLCGMLCFICACLILYHICNARDSPHLWTCGCHCVCKSKEV